MESVHVVVESSCDAVPMIILMQNFIKKFKMPSHDKLGDYTYLVPLSTISNHLCIYKNYGGRDNEFFCVLPQRMWSKFFSSQIALTTNDRNLEEAHVIDSVEDTNSRNNSDDDSLYSGTGGSAYVGLDYGESSDDSSLSMSDID